MIAKYRTAQWPASAGPLARCVLPAFIALLAPRAHADDYFSPTDDHVRVSLGAMHVSSSTNLQADSSAGLPGTEINGENDFGLDKANFEPKFQAMVRVAERQRLSFDYFTLDRSGNALAGANGTAFRNVVFPSGSPLQTQLSLRTLGIAYEYSFWHSETLELAATLGVHATDVSAMVKVQTPTLHIIQTYDEAGPVPTVGLDATWVLSKRFYFDGRAQYLDVHIDNLGGSLGFYELNALYRFRPNVSFALGYTDVRASITSTKPGQTGFFDFDSKGPQIFVRVAF